MKDKQPPSTLVPTLPRGNADEHSDSGMGSHAGAWEPEKMCKSGALSEIAEIISGYAFKSAWFGSGDDKIIRISDIKNNQVNSIKAVTFDSKINPVPEQFKLKEGDILMALSGATTGKIGVASKENEGSYLNQRVAIIRGKSKVNSDYIKYALSGDYLKKLLRSAGGAAQPNLSPKNLAAMKIPLPPLKEQKRIAAILDKADAIRRKRQQAIDLTDQLLRSVFLDMFGDPVTNPEGFEIKFLKDIAHIQIGPFGTQLHKEDYIEGGIPLINPTHIINGKLVPKSSLSISDDKHGSLSEYHLTQGDIIMGRRGEMGRCALITEKENGWMCGTGSLFIRPKIKGVFSEYLYTLLSSTTIKRYLEGESLGATMPNLNKGIVGNIKIPVPDEGTIKKYSQIRKKYDVVKNELKLFSDKELFKSLTQQAFNGQLSKQTKAA